MTSPDDDNPEDALRRALSEAVSGVEPGAGGLDKIRARIGNRPPRPWPLSVLVGVIDWVRNWTWRGHWAWQDSLPRPTAFWRPRSRRRNFPGWDTGGLRLVTVLAGIAVIAGITLGVSPFRNAILQASTVLQGGNRPPRATAATESNGTRTLGGSTPTADGGQIGVGSSLSAATKSTAAAPGPTSTAKCAPTKLLVSADAEPSPADAPAAAPTTSSAARTCSVTHPADSPAPTPASTSSSASTSWPPDPTPAATWPTVTLIPTDTAWSGSPTPTPTPTLTPTASSSTTGNPATPSPTDPPASPTRDRRQQQSRPSHAGLR